MANISIGIVGLPNVGKSTLFNALTKKSVPAENYPFCTIDPSVGIVPVPDPRLAQLSQLSQSAKTIPAVVEFVDIAGLVQGASDGAGLGNQFLSHIREVNAIAQVVRIFEDENIIHVSGAINPIQDIEVINLELVLADLQTVSKRLASVERDAKRADKEAVIAQGALKKIEAVLTNGQLAQLADLTDKEEAIIKGLQLLSMKPILYVLNKKAGAINLDEVNDERHRELVKFIENAGAKYCTVDAGVEHELKDLNPEDQESFRRELGSFDDGINELITKSYELLGLMTYFTTGKDESRAWTVENGSSAPEAGTAIHTDFRDKFIRAEVVSSDDLITAGSYVNARKNGLVRTEGKEYIVKDGDVIEFRI